MPSVIDISGQTFGHYLVLGLTTTPSTVRTSRTKYWLCECDCGNLRAVAGTSLRNGHARSCGCTRSASKRKHGHAASGRGGVTSTYGTWYSMKARCGRPGHISWPYYGARGVTVCERWESFENFLEDMGERPEGKTLDRIDPYGNYEPGNCRWATPREQALNRRKAS